MHLLVIIEEIVTVHFLVRNFNLLHVDPLGMSTGMYNSDHSHGATRLACLLGLRAEDVTTSSNYYIVVGCKFGVLVQALQYS